MPLGEQENKVSVGSKIREVLESREFSVRQDKSKATTEPALYVGPLGISQSFAIVTIAENLKNPTKNECVGKGN